MPDRRLGPSQLRQGRPVDLGEQQVDITALDRLVAVEGRLRSGRGKRLGVVFGRGLRVHRVQVNVMKMHRLDRRPLLCMGRPIHGGDYDDQNDVDGSA
jgi:hypothetical protein